MTWPIKKFLITGVPGTGKTNFGNYLAAKCDYIHFDMESSNYISVIMANPSNFIENIVCKHNSVVVTWGFVPCDEQIEVVNLFKHYCFKIIWFDGDRDAAKREFIRRDQEKGPEYLKSSLAALDLQMSRIENSGVVDRISSTIINTFKADHNFKGLDQILNEIENV